MNPRISILQPTRGRPEQCLETRDAWLAAAALTGEVEHVFAVDADDAATRSALQKIANHPLQSIVVCEPLGSVNAWNAAAAAATGEILVLVDDDLFPCDRWDALLLEKTRDVKGPAVFRLGVNRQGDQRVFPMALNRERLAAQGTLFHPGYHAVYADTDFWFHAERDGCVIDCTKEIVLHHANPLIDPTVPMDDTYRAENAAKHYEEGQRTFLRRMGACLPKGFRVMIATPFHDGRATVNYTLAMLTQTNALAEAGISWTYQASFSGVVHSQRNNLMASFLHSGADALVPLDSDMGWRGEDLVRMLASGLPCVTVNAPARNYFFDKFSSGNYSSLEEVRNALLRGVIRVLKDRPPVRGMKEIDYAGFSVAVIRREVPMAMIEKGLVPKLNEGNVLPPWLPWLYRFFAFGITAADHPLGGGRELHEDYSFCDLVRAAGFNVFCDPLAIVSHAGYHEFIGQPRWPHIGAKS